MNWKSAVKWARAWAREDGLPYYIVGATADSYDVYPEPLTAGWTRIDPDGSMVNEAGDAVGDVKEVEK